MTPDARHEPLRVDFFLSSPICLGQYEYVCLDGVVAHLRARSIDPGGYRRRDGATAASGGGMRAIHHRIIHHASVGLLDTDGPPGTGPQDRVPGSDDIIYKRLEMSKLCDPRLARTSNWKHTPGTGPYKHAAIRLVTVPARRVRFYARADERMLRDLLAGLLALGKKTAIGYGQIESLEIARIPDDRSVVWKGRAMRPIPCEMLESCETRERCGWRPPYWNAADARMCAPPGARVKLKSGNQLRRIEL